MTALLAAVAGGFVGSFGTLYVQQVVARRRFRARLRRYAAR